jgi:TolB-like protein/Tfp pilus assembly protein PilF
LFLALLLTLRMKPLLSPPRSPVLRAPAIDSIAVLPFVNASTDPNLDYVSDGITEGIINSLASLPNLRVIARTSVFSYKGRDFDPKKAARDLAVRALVTGKVLQRGDEILLTVDLVDTREDRELWGQQYTRKVAQLVAVQADIASEISDKLRLRLNELAKQHLSHPYTPSSEAYRLYLKGRYSWNSGTAQGLKNAIHDFQQSIAIDPGFAPAYAGLAECYNDLAALYFAEPKEVMPRAKAAAMKGLEIDESLAEAHSALGWALWNWDWDKAAAEREFRRAIELNSNSSTAHHRYGIFLSHLGRFDEGVAEGTRAGDLDPLSPTILAFLAYDYMVAGRYDEALTEMRNALALEPSNVVMQTGIPWIYAQQGRYPEALAACERLPKQALAATAENQGPALTVAWVYAMAGKKRQAERLLNSFKQLVPREHVDPYSIAEIYAALGDNDRTFEWLEQAYRIHSGAMVWLKADPFWKNVRSDARYEDLLRRIGLPG